MAKAKKTEFVKVKILKPIPGYAYFKGQSGIIAAEKVDELVKDGFVELEK